MQFLISSAHKHVSYTDSLSCISPTKNVFEDGTVCRRCKTRRRDSQQYGKLHISVVRLRFKQFMKGIAKWVLIAIPATLTNSSLEYLQHLLALRFRKRLTLKIHESYFKDHNFYAVPNLDNRIKNVDQVIVADVQKFAQSLSRLYSNISKPLLDCVVYNIFLAKSIGLNTLFILSTVVQLSTGLLRALTPPFGTLVSKEQKLEGDLHYAHSRILNNSEEIALWKGAEFERDVIQKKYSRLTKHTSRVFRLRVFYGMVEDFCIKYFWGSAGLLACAAPVFAERLPRLEEIQYLKDKDSFSLHLGKTDESILGQRTREFVANRRLLLSSSSAVGRIISGYKELVELSGYTYRVSELLDVLDDISNDQFVKPKLYDTNDDTQDVSSESGNLANSSPVAHRGEFIEKDYIMFDRVPIVSPTGEVLIKELSYVAFPGMNLLVLGPNGCGKSSMFRILGGLWPIYGTLRDQIIYPHSQEQMQELGVTDAELISILQVLRLDGIVSREGGFDARKEWRDCLSGGDKQRIAMARLYYHKPKFAIMDECTSSVSLEMEEVMYTHAATLGITMLTVSHRQSLWKYHNYLLEFDGKGGYLFTEFDPEERLELLSEKQNLEEQNQLFLDLEKRLGQVPPTDVE
ncbi:hypothetical protein BB560_003907 [Smittium megazygosporum]|uniref:ABC transporter domain-containing protein n=1 Tax=Smittium megazygosporum TaxID=133381 RepID=A0A2T9ZAT0_9FUNG|nr:hypothetical protein BB560_003907 [Smittium megazygosporum]